MTALRLFRFSGPIPEPGVHLSMHRALHKTRCGVVILLVVGVRPGCRDNRSAVAVSGRADLGQIDQCRLVPGWPPSSAAVLLAELFPRRFRVFTAYPSPNRVPRNIVLAALAVSHWIERQTGWSIRQFVHTARRYRTVEIRAGQHSLTAADPLPADLRDALTQIGVPDLRTK